MNEPNWAEILQVMYLENPPPHPIETASDTGDFTIAWLAENTSLKGKEVDKATDKLDNWGLITKSEMNMEGWQSGDIVEMLKDGFEVAHERELSKRNNRINYALVFLTFILVLAQIIGVLPLDDWVKVSSGVVILVGMLFVVWRTDLLER